MGMELATNTLVFLGNKWVKVRFTELGFEIKANAGDDAAADMPFQ